MASTAAVVAPVSQPKKFNWPEFWVLTAMGSFGCRASLPMLYPILPDTPAKMKSLASVRCGG